MIDAVVDVTLERRRLGRRSPAAASPATTVGVVAEYLRRPWLRGLLERDGLDVLVEAADPAGLIEACRTQQPDIAVFAFAAKLAGERALLKYLLGELPGVAVVVVAPGDERSGARRVIRAGAHCYVREADAERALAIAVRAAHAGQVCMPATVRPQALELAFSHRERQVLELVAHGLTNAEVGQRLFLAESTVKSHLYSSFRKLGVSSRAEAAALVLDPDSGFEPPVQPPAVERTLSLLASGQR